MFTQPQFFALAAAILITASPVPAQADVYASPPLYGGNAVANYTGTISCRIFNAGGTAVNITTRRIFSNTNVSMALSGDTCNVALGANKYCAFSYFSNSNLAFSCKIVTSQTGTRLRGVAEFIRSSDLLVTNTLPMTK